jgi:outer membrane lipoprotein-sorting protein
LLLFLFPCCTHLKTPVLKRVYPPCSPQEILPIIKDTGIPVALKGIAKVKVKSSDETFSVKELISAQSPHSLRLETLNPLGHPVFYAVTDGKEAFIFFPSEKKFYFGSASPQTLSRFISLNLSIEKLVPILLGRMPLIDYEDGQVSCKEADGFYILELSAQDGSVRQLLKISADTLTVVESGTYEQGGELITSVQFGDYEMIGDVLFPKRISVFIPHDETRVIIRYKQLELLPEISADEFRLTAPQGVEVVPLK